MRTVVVATHGHCFDGLCSAVMFTRLMKHLHPNDELTFTYRGMGYGPGERVVEPAMFTGNDNVILDYRFTATSALTWYFDHHVSAFSKPEDREFYERAAGASPRTMFHDGGYGSCTKLIADVGRQKFGLDTSSANVRDLVRWADMIDSAAFPNAEMAVMRSEPVLQLMTVVEAHGDDAFIARMVPRLLDSDVEDVARGSDVVSAYAPLEKQQHAFIELVKEHAEDRGRVVLVDLGDKVLETAAKFVTYALWPTSTYSVLLTRSPSKCKISVGYNPWAPEPRNHNIAAICERYGGGGHPVVGAAAFPASDLARAREAARAIADELAS
jgi:hypothetical protein